MLKIARKKYVKLPRFIAAAILDFLWKMGRAEGSSAQFDYIRYPYLVNIEKLIHDVGYIPRWSTIDTFIEFLEANEMKYDVKLVEEIKGKSGFQPPKIY